jgi:hypothetical protein
MESFHLPKVSGVRIVFSEPLLECEAIKKDFLRQAFARIASLDPASKTGRRGLTGALDVYHFLFDSALMRCDGNYDDADDLHLIADLRLNRLPESMLPSYRLNVFLRDVGARMSAESNVYRFTEKEYQAFLDRLIVSERSLVRVYGRYGKLCYRIYGKQETSMELLREAMAIVEEAQKAGFNPDHYGYYMGQLRDEARRLARELVREAPATAQKARRTTPMPAPEPKSRVSLEPVELTFAGTERDGKKLSPAVRWRASGGWAGIAEYRPLGEGLEALWCSGAVLFMRQPGKVVTVLADEQLSVDDVIADGRYVWVAASYERGLTVLDRDGDWLYYAGGNWRRINLRTGEEELLVDNPRVLPQFGLGGAWHIANSSHYGLVAFYAGTLYRVRIDERDPATKPQTV